MNITAMNRVRDDDCDGMEEEEGKLLRNEIIKCLSEENWEIVKEILQLLLMLLGVFFHACVCE